MPSEQTDWDSIAEAVEGTCDSIAAIAERYDVPIEDVDGCLSDVGTESCAGCGWWWASGDLDGDYYCPDCQGDVDAE